MQTYSNTINTNKTETLNLINRLIDRIAEKKKEINNLELDIETLKTNLNQILHEDFECFAWWNLMDSIVKKKKDWKSHFEYIVEKLIPEGAKEIFCENIENDYFDGSLHISFFYKERYFTFNFLAPRRRYFDVEHEFGCHSVEVYENGYSPYGDKFYHKKTICWSYDIDEIKNAPEKFLQTKEKFS